MNYVDTKVKEARMVAVKAHSGQYYDNIFPYEKHLDDVVAVLKSHGIVSPKLLKSAYMHDTIEDCNVSYNDIRTYFGEDVAEIVYCVTDEIGRNRKERKLKTLPKTASNKDAVIIKVADRIANINHGGKLEMYAKEYFEFRNILKQSDRMAEPLWDTLDGLMDYHQSEVNR